MKLIRWSLLVLFCCVGISARATTFSVLLSGQEDKTECDVPWDSTAPADSVRPTRMYVSGTLVWIIRPTRLTIDFDPVLPQGSKALPNKSWCFAVKLTDEATGQELTRFPGSPLTIGFNTPLNDADAAKHCLGYLNEASNPPKWECQDAALKKDSGGYLCGTTDHLTIFTLAETSVVPEPASISVIAFTTIAMLKRKR